MNDPNLQPLPPPKVGPSGIAIFFIVCGVLTVLALGTCGVSALILKNKFEQLKDDTDGGGIVLVAPPEVVAELAGPKKDYVGSWKSKKDSTVRIAADGTFQFARDEGGSKETITAAIAVFKGNDIEVHALIRLTFPVTSPPHEEGEHWSMTMKGITFERD